MADYEGHAHQKVACKASALGLKLKEHPPPSYRNLKLAHLLMMSNLSTTDQSQRILLLGRRDYYTFCILYKNNTHCVTKTIPIVLQK